MPRMKTTTNKRLSSMEKGRKIKRSQMDPTNFTTTQCCVCRTRFEYNSTLVTSSQKCDHKFCPSCMTPAMRNLAKGELFNCPFCEGKKMRKCKECNIDSAEFNLDTCTRCSSFQAISISRQIPGISHKARNFPYCANCDQAYNNNDRLPKKLDCGHTFCAACLEAAFLWEEQHVSRCDYVPCSLCPEETRLNGLRNFKRLDDNEAILEEMERMIKNAKNETDCVTVMCTECAKTDVEQDMHICQVCTLEKHEFDVEQKNTAMTIDSVDPFAICSTCVLKSHITKGHKIVAFYPLRAELRFNKNRNRISLSANNLDNHLDKLTVNWNTSRRVIASSRAQMTKIVNLMARSKSSVITSRLFNRNSNEIQSLVSFVQNLNTSFEQFNEKQHRKLNELTKFLTEIEVLQCTPESEETRKIVQRPIPNVLASEVKQEEPAENAFQSIQAQQKALQMRRQQQQQQYQQVQPQIRHRLVMRAPPTPPTNGSYVVRKYAAPNSQAQPARLYPPHRLTGSPYQVPTRILQTAPQTQPSILARLNAAENAEAKNRPSTSNE